MRAALAGSMVVGDTSWLTAPLAPDQRVGSGEAVVVGHREGEDVEPERLGDPRRQQVDQAGARRSLQEDAQDVGRGVVGPAVTGLEGERERREGREHLVGPDQGRLRARMNPGIEHGPGQRRRVDPHAQAARHRQQVSNEDRSSQRHRLGQLGVGSGEHPKVGELRQPGHHRLVEVEHPALDQLHGQEGCHRLGQRGDAVGRVNLEGRRAAKVAHSSAHPHEVVAEARRDRVPGHAPVGDQGVQPRRVETLHRPHR